jgi:antitoxin MazE
MGERHMQATISKWGNSLALRLPRHLTDRVNLTEGTAVDFEVEDGMIKIVPTRKKFKLSELLEGEPKSAEFDWGKPSGDETW